MNYTADSFPRYTAKDILGDRPKYRGGLAAYQRDKKAQMVYARWHYKMTKGKCSNCRNILGL